MINRNSAHPDAAWDFIHFVTGPEGQKINALVASQLPTYMALYDDEDILAANPHFANMKESLAAAVARPVSPIYTALSEIMQINISAVLLGNMTVEDAGSTMEQQMMALNLPATPIINAKEEMLCRTQDAQRGKPSAGCRKGSWLFYWYCPY